MKHKHCEVIKAWADGAKVQVKSDLGWLDVSDPMFSERNSYRVRPERKPDVALDKRVCAMHGAMYFGPHADPNIRITFDGETGLPKKVELIGSEV